MATGTPAQELLLPARQEWMRQLAAGLADGTTTRPEALRAIRKLIKAEEASADGSRATMARSEHAHVQKSGAAALRNRLVTIEHLRDAQQALIERRDKGAAATSLSQAAGAGGKKSVKAARKAPTVALYVQYLAETDQDFRNWLTSQGVTVA